MKNKTHDAVAVGGNEWRRDFSSGVPARDGFSLVELLVTVGIAAAVLSTAVILFAAISSARSTGESSGVVEIGESVFTQFFPQDPPSTRVATFFAPNFGRTASAEELKELLLEDLKQANAVFCLGRTGHDSFRATSIPLPSGFDPGSLDTPGAFRSLLADVDPDTGMIFSGSRGVLPGNNLSMFVLAPSSLPGELNIRAIYEVDLVETSTPPGVYASVRRYVGNTLSSFYDVFYPDRGEPYALSPLAVCFEREVRAAVDEGAFIDPFKRASERPFYFVWWPDPAIAVYSSTDATFDSGDPRSNYSTIGEATSLFFVVPMFPSL